MSIKKAISEARGNRTAAEVSVRAQQEAKTFALGYPSLPPFIWNNRPLYAIWKRYSKWLYERLLLSYSDGAALLELCEAELNGQTERKKRALTAWKRKQFPAPIIAGNTLVEFINKVRTERSSFSDRLRHDVTVCLDENGQEYEFLEADAATIARKYAIDSLASSDVGLLIKQACTRWLQDLEDGHTRGVYFDPVAARNIVEFVRVFYKLELMAWEVWVLVSVFAFKRATGLRKHSEVWLSVARKNGKTAFAGAVALFMLLCDQEKYAEVYAAATAKDQSRIVWKDARRAVKDSPALFAHVKCWAGELHVDETDSKFCPLASEDRSFLGVRASGIVADEVGVWTDRNAWDVLIQSTVSRTQPLTFAITTAPAHRMTFAHEKFTWAERILRGIVTAEHVFAAIYRIDDGDDPKDIVKLRKANPSFGVTLREEHLVKQIAELSDTPSGLNNFLQFHCNVTPEKTLQRTGSISPKKWDACTGFDLIGETDTRKAVAKFLQMNTDTPCYLGVDIGIVNDLTAVVMLFPKGRFAEDAEPLDKRIVICQCFAPELNLLEKERTWGAPLSTWAREGFLQLLPGDMVDLREIKQFVIDLNTKFRVHETGFDPYAFPSQAAELNEAGITCVAVAQVHSQLTAPCNELAGSVSRGDLVHFGNPLLKWMASNVIMAESERTGGVKPEKLSPSEKIDGISALVTAWHRFLANPVHGAPRIGFLMQDNSFMEPGPDGKNIQTREPLMLARNKGSVAQDN